MADIRALFVTMAFVSPAVVFADAPFATASFEREVAGLEKRVPISTATLDDMVCFVVNDMSTPSGDHTYHLVIYDGGGIEVHQSTNRITARDNKWGFVTCYGYQERRDKPGTWWYVAELDDQPLISKELTVAAGR